MSTRGGNTVQVSGGGNGLLIAAIIIILGLIGLYYLSTDNSKCVEWKVRCQDRATQSWEFHPGVFYTEIEADAAAASLGMINNQECESYCSKNAEDDQPDRTVQP